MVSEGELRRALAAGIPPAKIMFSGVGKTAREMDFALAAGIHCFNVESEPELELLSARAVAAGVVAPISLRINPDVDARTHRKIATGKAENKFGIPWQRARHVYARAAALPGIRVTGIDTHIGSQITELQPFDDAFALLATWSASCAPTATPSSMSTSAAGWASPTAPTTSRRHCPTPMRRSSSKHVTAARAQGDLRAGPPDRRQCRHPGHRGDLCEGRRRQEFRHRRRRDERPDPPDALRRLPRDPAGRRSRPPTRARITADVVGPVCETGDFLALDRDLPRLEAGDLIAVGTAGAYGAVQAGTYNSRLLVPEVLVDGDRFHVVRPRPTYDDLIGLDSVPDWL